MKWATLPVAGGLYDQHPELLKKFTYIFEQQGIEQEKERKKAKREQESAARSRSRRPRARGY